MSSPGFPEPAAPVPPPQQLSPQPPPLWQPRRQPGRTKTSWLLGAFSIGVGAFWTWGLLVEALMLSGPPDSPVALLGSFMVLLFGLPGLLLLVLGVRFMRRPGLSGLESLMALLAFAAGVCLTAALLVVWKRLLPEEAVLSACVFTATLLVLPVHVLALVRCAALTGLARLNPWLAVGPGWVLFLAVQIWYALVFYPKWWLRASGPSLTRGGGGGGGAGHPDTRATVTLDIILPFLLPILAAWLFARVAAWWLSRKARAWEGGRRTELLVISYWLQ